MAKATWRNVWLKPPGVKRLEAAWRAAAGAPAGARMLEDVLHMTLHAFTDLCFVFFCALLVFILSGCFLETNFKKLCKGHMSLHIELQVRKWVGERS